MGETINGEFPIKLGESESVVCDVRGELDGDVGCKTPVIDGSPKEVVPREDGVKGLADPGDLKEGENGNG
jgi:hypothetical protein